MGRQRPLKISFFGVFLLGQFYTEYLFFFIVKLSSVRYLDT